MNSTTGGPDPSQTRSRHRQRRRGGGKAVRGRVRIVLGLALVSTVAVALPASAESGEPGASRWEISSSYWSARVPWRRHKPRPKPRPTPTPTAPAPTTPAPSSSPTATPTSSQGATPTPTGAPTPTRTPAPTGPVVPPVVSPTDVPSGSGKHLFVATTGSDSAAGTEAAPLRTIQKAVDVAAAGDVIEVRAGTYSGNVIVRRPGTSSAWITLRGHGSERPVLTSSSSGPTLWFYHSKCDEDVIGNSSANTDCQPMYWLVQGLQIQGSPSGGGDGNAVKIDTPKVRLVGNKLAYSVADVVKIVRTANDAQVVDNEIWQDSSVVKPSSNAQGVDITGADRVRVAGNYLHDLPDMGVYAKGNAREPLFESNVLVNIGTGGAGNGLMLGQSTDAERLADGRYESYDGLVRNNVVVNTTEACLATASSFNARFVHNSCYNTATKSQGSLRTSNESEVGQAGTNITFLNNIVYGSTGRPVVKIGSNSLTDYKTLVFDHNLYYVSGGAPQFTSSDHFNSVNFADWKTKYTALTGRTDASLVADPGFSSTSGRGALTLGGSSPAIDAAAGTALVGTDLTGASRPKGKASDIGAYEQS